MKLFGLSRTFLSTAALVGCALVLAAPGCASGGEDDMSPGGTAGTAARDGGGGAAAADGSAGSGGGGTGGTSATGGTGGGGAGSGGTAGGGGTSGGGASGTSGASGAAGADASTDASDDGATDGGDEGGDADAPLPCHLLPELCNGLDDNCNGVPDEGNPGGGGACTVTGLLGVCADGVLECNGGVVICLSTGVPSPESCNGLDDNCNGATDEGNPEGGGPCTTGLQGVCAIGTAACTGGARVCQQNTQSSTEVCNGLDDNCDGVPDDGFGGGQPCTVDTVTPNTPCASGLSNCLGGQSGCTQTVFPAAEACDGVDNDCNGTIDDSSSVSGSACDTGQLGVCQSGRTTCSGGAAACEREVNPSTEVCNGLDDDCNGDVDDVADINAECSTKNPSAGQVAGWRCTVGFCAVDACNANYSNCDGAPANGCETSLQNDPLNCSACSTVCGSTNGTPTCAAGACGITCNGGYGNCDGNAANGCEAALSTSVTDCGACGTSCTNAHGGATCSAGTCQASCDTGWGNCDSNAGNGCETSTFTDTSHCGGCGLACTNPNGSTSCDSGVCTPVCSSAGANCDGNARNGCETNKLTDTQNCGGCGVACTNPNGTSACNNGFCAPVCSTNAGDCDGNPNNGCETSLSTVQNCGGCGTTCSNTNGSTACSGGACLPSCTANYASCDGNANNGCETYLRTDPDHCGACGFECQNDHGTTTCQSGQCSPTCDPNWGNCDADKQNGCETNLLTNVSNCGGCGIVCSNANGTAACVNGACVPSCASGYGNCDGNPNNGCETSTDTAVNHCGACGNVCVNPGGGVSCVGGTCAPGCNPGFGNCDGNNGNGCETNILNNVSNCGGCGQACTNPNGTTSCSSGNCAPVCSSGWGNCDGNAANGCETNTNTSAANCGACGTTCTNAHGSTSCSSGGCQPVCSSGWADCDGNPANGCETDTSTTAAHCGGCGIACSNPNGSTSCVGGTCQPVCGAGGGNCDGNAVNGCETNVNTSTSHCGACGNGCSNPHGTTTCNSGVCSPSCSPATWAVCSGDPDLGCQVDTATSATNCGACGNACTVTSNQSSVSGTFCSGSNCGVTCNSGYYDQNSTYSDGCECQADSLPDTCASAQNVGSLAVGSSTTQSGKVLGGTDEDWFRITYAAGATCSFKPKVTLTHNGNPIRMQVYNGPSCANGISCADAGTSAASGGITSWEFTYTGACGDNQAVDPTPGAGSFINGASPTIPNPTEIWIKVYATGSAATCMNYTLTFDNKP